jgi:hypothetical protein
VKLITHTHEQRAVSFQHDDDDNAEEDDGIATTSKTEEWTYLASLEQDMQTAESFETDSASGMSSRTVPKGFGVEGRRESEEKI